MFEGGDMSKQILIVEDEEIVRKILEMQIASFGYEVHSAELPGEGISWFVENKDMVDLVLLDMNMPEMDGLEVFRRMKDVDPDVKVLVLSGYSQHGKIEAALKEGVIDYLTKPVRKAVLADKIEEIISKRSTGRDVEEENMTGGYDSNPVLDRMFLEDQFKTTPGLMTKVIGAFLVSTPDLVESLETAVSEGTIDEVVLKAHKCHGPIVSLGGIRAGAWVKALEKEAEKGEQDNIGDLMAGFKRAYEEFIRVLETVNSE